MLIQFIVVVEVVVDTLLPALHLNTDKNRKRPQSHGYTEFPFNTFIFTR